MREGKGSIPTYHRVSNAGLRPRGSESCIYGRPKARASVLEEDRSRSYRYHYFLQLVGKRRTLLALSSHGWIYAGQESRDFLVKPDQSK